jgi:hypothetical protein
MPYRVILHDLPFNTPVGVPNPIASFAYRRRRGADLGQDDEAV